MSRDFMPGHPLETIVFETIVFETIVSNCRVKTSVSKLPWWNCRVDNIGRIPA